MELNHHRQGDGPPLVLVHGIGSQWQVWAPVIDRLAVQREVIAIDLPGFGASAALPAGVTPTIEAHSDAVVEFLGGLGVECPHVAGNSMGGWIALELARRGTVASATALSPAGFWNRREAAYCRGVLRASVSAARAVSGAAAILAATPLGRAMLLGHVMARPWRMSGDEAVAGLRALADSPSFDRTLGPLTNADFAENGAMPVPVTVAWGEKDRLLIPRQARRAARAIPRARHVTLYGCGHIPTWDDPEQVTRVILEASS